MTPGANSEGVENSVRESRTKYGITQEELGNAIGLSRKRIRAIERGRFTPSVLTALKLAQALDTFVECLFWLPDVQQGEV